MLIHRGGIRINLSLVSVIFSNYTKKDYFRVLCWFLLVNKSNIGNLKYWIYHILNMHYIPFIFFECLAEIERSVPNTQSEIDTGEDKIIPFDEKVYGYHHIKKAPVGAFKPDHHPQALRDG